MDAPPTFGPVGRDDSLSNKVYQSLRSALVGGRLVPGQRLVHRQLAQELGVSPTPVRDALMRLASEGALTLDARGIALVPRLDRERYSEIMDLRVELEGRAAARAALVATGAELTELRAIQARLVAGRGDSSIIRAEHEGFHFRILAMARMPVLQRMVENLWVQVGPTINLLFDLPATARPTDHPHDALIRALEAREPEAARIAIQHDLQAFGRLVADLLER